MVSLSRLLKSDVWLLLILAVVIAAILVCSQSTEKSEKLGAFFEVLGDAIALLALCGSGCSPSCETVSG